MRMSKSKQQRLTEEQQQERTEQELYGIHKQLSEHYEKCAVLWSHVDGMSLAARQCYEQSAQHMQKACDLLLKAAEARENSLDPFEGDPDDQ